MFLLFIRTLAVLISYFHAVSSYTQHKSSNNFIKNSFKLNFYNNNPITSRSTHGNARLITTKLNSLGTDLIERPDDEDSPEFREYLRQLMSMQVNRAKSGFAAPSSASSDAYFAKLNRIKVEKLKLRELGLPEDIVSTGYQPEDFVNAKYEAQEPTVSATGGLTIPSDGITRTTNAKTRALTKEEIETERNAQVNVQKYLESQKAKGLSVVDTTSNESARPPPVVVNMDPGTVSLIDKLLSRSGMPGTGTATALPKSGASSAPQQSPQQRAPAPATPASTQARVQTNQQQQQQQQKQKQPVRPATPTQTVKSVPAVPKAVSPPTVTAKLSPPPQRLTASTPNVQTAANTGKPLSEEENQAIKDSTEWLIKHRGGGPFGAGRLQTQAEILELEQSLLKMVDVIRHDTETNFNTAPVAATTSATQKNNDRFAEPKKPLPQLSKPVASAPVAAPRQAAAAPALVKQVVAQPKPVMQSPPVTPSLSTAVAPIEEGPIPIALGLDRFLAAPESASVMEMEGLRDGLIECLSLLQRNIRERVFAGESVQTPPNAAPVSAPATAASTTQSPSTKRLLESKEPLPLDQELKLALGLLLKHRGGPGFGHGRLEGNDLDALNTRLRGVVGRLTEEANQYVQQ